MSERITDYRKVVEYKPKSSFANTMPLIDLLNTEFIITDVEFVDGNYGKVALITVEGYEEKFRTSSKVLLKQLEEIKELIEKGYKVKVKLRRVKRYYTF